MWELPGLDDNHRFESFIPQEVLDAIARLNNNRMPIIKRFIFYFLLKIFFFSDNHLHLPVRFQTQALSSSRTFRASRTLAPVAV